MRTNERECHDILYAILVAVTCGFVSLLCVASVEKDCQERIDLLEMKLRDAQAHVELLKEEREELQLANIP